MTWRYVDHPESGDMVPANTHAEVAEIAEALRRVGECCVNIYEMDDDTDNATTTDEATRLLSTARPTGEAILAGGTVIAEGPQWLGPRG